MPASNACDARQTVSVVNTKINIYNLVGNIDEIIRKVKANIHCAANPTEACPARRKKVDDLRRTPSSKMVGSVSEVMKK